VYYAGHKIESKLQEKEPEFRQYVTMTTEEQNAYVKKNLDEFFILIAQFSGDEDEEEIKATLKELDNYPEISQAGIEWGRSCVASFILWNENIVKDLSADVLNKLKTEQAELNLRNAKYKAVIEKYKQNLK
jgi:phosphoribosylanthranilate isomerase